MFEGPEHPRDGGSVARVFTWPERLPAPLDGLFEAVIGQGDGLVMQIPVEPTSFERERGAAMPGDACIVVPEATHTEQPWPAQAVDGLARVLAQGDLNVVIVVSNALLGTDVSPPVVAALPAVALGLARSTALTRGTTTRANVVVVPEAFFERASQLRGPLAVTVEREDVVAALQYLLSEEGTYLNGQALFLDCGRHLFSSLSA